MRQSEYCDMMPDVLLPVTAVMCDSALQRSWNRTSKSTGLDCRRRFNGSGSARQQCNRCSGDYVLISMATRAANGDDCTAYGCAYCSPPWKHRKHRKVDKRDCIIGSWSRGAGTLYLLNPHQRVLAGWMRLVKILSTHTRSFAPHPRRSRPHANQSQTPCRLCAPPPPWA